MRNTLLVVLMLAGVSAGARTIDPAAPRDVVSIGHDASLKEGDTARDLVVIGGDADVQGQIERDLVVIGGDAKLGPKAAVGRDAVVVVGTLDANPTAVIGREKTLISAQGLTAKLGRLSAVTAATLFKARPVAPSHTWTWAISLGFLFLYVLIALGAPQAVDACAAALEERPVGAFLAGALGLAGVAPFGFLLIVSVVGIAVIPLLLLAAFAALALGKASLCRFLGGKAGIANAAAATALGGAALLLLYFIPVVGGLAWALACMLGFGSALLAGVEQLQRERSTSETVTKPAPAQVAAAAPVSPALPESALPRAGFWLRAAAFVIDLFAWAVLGAITHLHLLGLGGWAIYQIGMWVWKGTTLGGLVVGIKGARADGRPMDLTVALVRHLASYLSALPMCLGFFWAGFDPEKQTWHDKIAGTIVVRVPHGQALV